MATSQLSVREETRERGDENKGAEVLFDQRSAESDWYAMERLFFFKTKEREEIEAE